MFLFVKRVSRLNSTPFLAVSPVQDCFAMIFLVIFRKAGKLHTWSVKYEITVDIKQFMYDCLYDVCVNEGRQEVLCEALSSYNAECQKAGVTVSPWRELANCGKLRLRIRIHKQPFTLF